MSYPMVMAVHWTADAGDYTHSRGGDLSWDDAWAELDAAFAQHDTICYVVEWTNGHGPRITFQWQHRDLWNAHGGHGPARFKDYCVIFSAPAWEEYDPVTGEPTCFDAP